MTLRDTARNILWAFGSFVGSLLLVFYAFCLFLALTDIAGASERAREIIKPAIVTCYILTPLGAVWFFSRWGRRRRILPDSMRWLEIGLEIAAVLVLGVLLCRALRFGFLS